VAIAIAPKPLETIKTDFCKASQRQALQKSVFIMSITTPADTKRLRGKALPLNLLV
jgi:hypothetical protein